MPQGQPSSPHKSILSSTFLYLARPNNNFTAKNEAGSKEGGAGAASHPARGASCAELHFLPSSTETSTARVPSLLGTQTEQPWCQLLPLLLVYSLFYSWFCSWFIPGLLLVYSCFSSWFTPGFPPGLLLFFLLVLLWWHWHSQG